MQLKTVLGLLFETWRHDEVMVSLHTHAGDDHLCGSIYLDTWMAWDQVSWRWKTINWISTDDEKKLGGNQLWSDL